MKTVKALLIDPETRTVTNVEYNDETLAGIYALLKCRVFEIPYYFENGDALYVDEEGTFRETRDFFMLRGFEWPISGRALIVGTMKNGETGDCESTQLGIADQVMWINRDAAGRILRAHRAELDLLKESLVAQGIEVVSVEMVGIPGDEADDDDDTPTTH